MLTNTQKLGIISTEENEMRIHQIYLSGSFRFVADRLDQLSDIGYSMTGFTEDKVNGQWVCLVEKEIY